MKTGLQTTKNGTNVIVLGKFKQDLWVGYIANTIPIYYITWNNIGEINSLGLSLEERNNLSLL